MPHKKTMADKSILLISLIGSCAAIISGISQIDYFFIGSVSELQRGIVAGTFLAPALAIVSIFIGKRYSGMAFILLFTAAFMMMVSFWFVPGVGRLFAIIGSIFFIIGACLRFIIHLKNVDSRGISRM